MQTPTETRECTAAGAAIEWEREFDRHATYDFYTMRACPCGHPDNRALCDVWACPFLPASVAPHEDGAA
jgi:hypothetical protein